MGTENAKLLSAVANTNRMDGTSQGRTLMSDLEVVNPAKPGARMVCPRFVQSAASFLLPGEFYFTPFLKRLGTEVKR